MNFWCNVWSLKAQNKGT